MRKGAVDLFLGVNPSVKRMRVELRIMINLDQRCRQLVLSRIHLVESNRHRFNTKMEKTILSM